MSSQTLSVIEVWAAVAWADGVLAEPEASCLRALIRTAQLAEPERIAAGKLLERRVELPEAYLAGLSVEARRGIYRAACRMAVVDHVFAATERSLLDRLCGKLAIPADVAAEIEADVPGLAI